MIHDLPTLARAREQEIRRQLLEQARLPRRTRRRNLVSALMRRALCRLGTRLVLIGRRLECYDFRLVGESDYATG